MHGEGLSVQRLKNNATHICVKGVFESLILGGPIEEDPERALCRHVLAKCWHEDELSAKNGKGKTYATCPERGLFLP